MKHLPASEPDPHVVRVGWSLDTCSTQLGKWTRELSKRKDKEAFLFSMDQYDLLDLTIPYQLECFYILNSDDQ